MDRLLQENAKLKQSTAAPAGVAQKKPALETPSKMPPPIPTLKTGDIPTPPTPVKHQYATSGSHHISGSGRIICPNCEGLILRLVFFQKFTENFPVILIFAAHS